MVICVVYDCNEEADDGCVVESFVVDRISKERVLRQYKFCEEHHRMFVGGLVDDDWPASYSMTGP